MRHPDLKRIYALADGELQGKERDGFMKHLGECRTCADARTQFECLRALAKSAVTSAPVPDIDWDRAEGALLTRIAATTNGSSAHHMPWWRLLVPAAVAMLLVLGISYGSRVRGIGDATQTTVATTEVPAELRLAGVPSHGVVTLVQGRVRASLRLGEPPRVVSVASSIDEGAHLHTAGNALVAVQTAPDTGFQLAPGSDVEVVALRSTGAVLRLGSGAVANRVRHLRTDEEYRIVSGDLLIEVRGTRFDVRREQSTTVVAVSEGTVAVRKLRARGSEEVLLHAPAVARFEDGIAVARAERGSAVPDLGDLWVHVPRGTQSSLRLPELPDVSKVEVDGIGVGTGDSLLRHARGTAEVVVYPLEGGPIRTEVAVDRTTATFRMPEARPEPPSWRPSGGTIDRGALSRAMASYSQQVRRCYDRRLKRVPTLRERIELRLTIGADGTVTDAQLRGEGHDPEVSECVLTVARRWTFQAPQGGAVTVSVPFNFAPHGRMVGEDPDAGP